MTVVIDGTLGITTPSETITGGTANGVAYLNGSKVLTTGSALVFDGSNLGLGVTPYAWFSGSSAKVFQNNNGSFYADSANSISLASNWGFTSAGAQQYISNGFATRYIQSSGQHIWNTAASGTAGNAISFTQAMTLTAAGNLAIGATASSNRLTVLGSSDISTFASTNATTGYVTYQYNTSTVAGYIGNGPGLIGTAGATDFIIRSENALVFSTSGGNERARIDSSGNLLVGVTAGSDGSIFKASNSTLNVYRTTSTAAEGLLGIYSNVGGTNSLKAYFRADGGLANFSANNVNLSDERLKKNITPAGDYLAKICAIPVKTFRYNDQAETEDLTLGVIAQEVQQIAPELVSVDGFGVNEENQQDYLSIYQTDLQYALMKCIQEQQAIIEDMKTRITAAGI